MSIDEIAGRYRVVRELGRGGMGVVLLVVDRSVGGPPLALKLLNARSFSASAVRHFEQEFRTLASLSHPHLVEVRDFGREPVPYFTMEYVEGKTLSRALAGATVDFPLLYRCLAQLGEALAHLHAHGFVHQDVKPSNALVADGSDGSPHVKLMDLGLAGPPRAGSGKIRGTVAYLSPEAARGADVDPRADLYALGCVAYELATGRPPFQDASPLAVVRAHLTESPIPPRTLNRDVPPEFERLVLRLLSKEPGGRPSGADRFLELLDEVAGGTLSPSAPRARRDRVLGGGFVGRAEEVDRLLAHVRRSREEASPIVLLLGEAGIGKSRLLRELQVRVQLDGGDLVVGSTPAEALAKARTSRGHVEPTESLPAAFAAAAGALAREAPTVLAVEDLHLADEASIAALRHLAGAELPPGLAVLATCRGEEISRSSPLFDLVADGRASGAIEEFAVGPFSSEEAAALLRSRLATDPIPPAFLQRMLEETRGNPLHLVEVSALLAAEGHVRPGSGEPIDPDALAAIELPSRIRDLVERRLARLADEDREILEAAAALGGDDVDPDAVAAVSGRRWESVARSLGALAGAALLVRDDEEDGTPVFRPAHRGLVERVAELTEAGRDRTLHERALSYLERRGVPRSHAAWSAIARHAERAGRNGRAMEAWEKAGDLAAEIHANREAIAAWGQAIEIGHRLDGVPAGVACGIYEKRGRRRALGGELAPAEEDARWMLARAEKAEQDPLRARALLMLGEILSSRERSAEALDALEIALAIAERLPDDDLAAAASTAAGRASAAAGAADDAAAAFDRSVAIAKRAGSAAREAEALAAKGSLLRAQGDFRGSLSCFEEARRRAGRAASSALQASVLEGEAIALEVQGKYREAIAAYERARHAAAARGDAAGENALTLALGVARGKTGDDPGARAAAEEALLGARRLGSQDVAVRARLLLSAIETRRGAFDAARDAAEEALRQARRGSRRDLAAAALHRLGELDLRLGDLDGASRHLDEAEDLMRDRRSPRDLAAFLADLSELRRALGDGDAARKLAQEAAFVARKAGDRRLESAALLRWGEANLVENDWDRASVACRKALSLVEGAGLPREDAEGKALRARIELARPGGDTMRAELDALEALESFRALREEESAWQAEHLAARAAARLGRREEAAERVARAWRHLESVRSRLPAGAEARWLADPRRRDLYDDFERLRPALTERRPEAGAAEEASPSGELASLREENRTLRRLLEVILTFGETRDPERLLSAILEAAVELTGAERGFVLAGAPGALVVRAETGGAGGAPSLPLADRAVASRGPVLDADPEAGGAGRSVLAVPLAGEGEERAVVVLDRPAETGPFGPRHVETATRLSSQAAIALETARLLSRIDEQRETLDRLNRELERTAAAQRAELADARERLVSTHSSLELRSGFEELIGGSPAMQRVYHRIERLAPKRLPVLVVGETGTGKELIARALHSRSDRSGGPFFTVNCAALPENLLESELFGYRKGAFTGADRNKPGYFELANGGTLFLDEIGEMGAAMQAKLLRVLQEGEVLPVGGHAPLHVDVRVVSATHRDLEERIREGTFREDLYYRIHVARIDVPPLSERREDVPLLVEHFLRRLAEDEGGEVREVEPEVLRLLAEAEWPGNVRQLEHHVLRMCAFARGGKVTVRDLRRYGDLAPARDSAPAPHDRGVESLDELERRQIQRALETAAGNKTRAAEILGINRATLFRKLKRYELER